VYPARRSPPRAWGPVAGVVYRVKAHSIRVFGIRFGKFFLWYVVGILWIYLDI
jgi:hypothetical protein